MPWIFDTIGFAMLAFLTVDRVMDRLNQRTDLSVEQVKRMRVAMIVAFLVSVAMCVAAILYSRFLVEGALGPAHQVTEAPGAVAATPCGADKPTSPMRK